MSQFYTPQKRPSKFQVIVYNTSQVSKKPFELNVRPGVFWFIVSIVLLLFVGIGIALSFYTPVLKFAPNVIDRETYQRDVTINKIKIDSLMSLVKSRTDYFSQFKLLMKPDTLDTTSINVKPGTEGIIGISSPDLTKNENKKNTIGDSFMADEEDFHSASSADQGEALSSSDLSGGISNEGFDAVSLGHFVAMAPIKGVFTRGIQPIINHFGVDIAAKKGTPVYAMSSGRIIFVDWTFQSGYTIIIQHAANFITVYKHLNSSLVKNNQIVSSGEVIALSGNTGELTSGPHLHIELWHNGNYLNPMDYFSRSEIK